MGLTRVKINPDRNNLQNCSTETICKIILQKQFAKLFYGLAETIYKIVLQKQFANCFCRNLKKGD